MPNNNDVPRGIRNNNPGNLRNPVLQSPGAVIVDGFARFRLLQDGLDNLAHLCHVYYHAHHIHTVLAFVERYAPSSENDVASYAAVLASHLRIPERKVASQDMRLDLSWHMLDLLRGIIHVENGPPPSRLSIGGEWCGMLELHRAIQIGYAEPRT